MISKEEVLKLAELARLHLGEGEVESLQKDISSILDYVGQVSAVEAPTAADEKPLLRNALREDESSAVLGDPESLQQAFPRTENGFNVVRKIIQKDE
jgi:aspartyl-tRNA(Asn)/glutamyl-tRNA(Gln) amidotransferase subunit C